MEHEVWVPIDGFPGYSVSSYGRVRNDNTGRIMQTSHTSRDAEKIGLIRDGNQHTCLVKNLVTAAFLPPPDEIFNTAINLDGDKSNNAPDNLAWRPRWFAVKYARQFEEDHQHRDRGPLRDLGDGRLYDHVYEACTVNGLLFKEVYYACTGAQPVFPTQQIFAWLH